MKSKKKDDARRVLSARLDFVSSSRMRPVGHTMVAAFLLVAQLGGGTPGSNAAEQIEHSVTRPVPQAPAAPVYRAPDVWVPDRVLSDPAQGGTYSVPGHWERRLSDGQYYAPPATVCDSGNGCSTTPAGERPSPDTRIGP